MTDTGWLAWRQEQMPLSADDVVLRVQGNEWPGAASELLWARLAGARVIEVGADDPACWAQAGIEHGVTVACLWPSQLAQFLHASSHEPWPRLRAVVCGGEPLSSELARDFLRLRPVRLLHFHAPDGMPPVMCADVESPSLLGEHAAVGSACAGWRVELVDELGRRVPRGIVGRLEVHDLASGAIHRTSDRGRMTRTGLVALVQERSGLAWYRGHLVDAGKVTLALRAMAGVRDAHVALRRRRDHGSTLLAWIVPEARTSLQDLEAAVARQLPAPLRPSAIVLVSALPLTPQGSVDVDALVALPAWPPGSAHRLRSRLLLLPDATEAAALKIQATDPTVSIAQSPRPLADVRGSSASMHVHDATDEQELVRAAGAALTPVSGCLADRLMATAKKNPEHGLRFIDANGRVVSLSYRELLIEASRVATGLCHAGAQRGDFALLLLADMRQFIAGLWGSVLAGLVPVPMAVPPKLSDDSAGVRKLLNTWAMLPLAWPLSDHASSEAIDCFPRPEGARAALSIEDLLEHEPQAKWNTAAPDDLALVLLTSGSTGRPKLVMHSHRTLLNRCEAARRHRGYHEHDVSLNWLPLDHVGAVVMFHLRDVVVGCEQIHVDTGYVLSDPLRWLDLLHRFRVSVTWAPNFAFALVNAQSNALPRRAWDLSCLRVLINAGESILARTARRFIELLLPMGLPHDAMKPEWGMSETSSAVTGSPGFTLASTRDDDRYVELGGPLPGTELRVVGRHRAGDDTPTGRLQVRGASVAMGYYGNAAATSEAFSADGWFDTGDLAQLRDGKLVIVGRHKDSIIVNGNNFQPHEIEAVIEELPGLRKTFTTVCAWRAVDADTDGLIVFFVPDDETAALSLTRAVHLQVVRRFGLQPAHVVPAKPHEIPKTAIGKLQRAQLRLRFDEGAFDERLRAMSQEYARDAVLAQTASTIWRRCAASHAAAALPQGSYLVLGGKVEDAECLAQTLREGGTAVHVAADADADAVQEDSAINADTIVWLVAQEASGLDPAQRIAHLLVRGNRLLRAWANSSSPGCRRRLIIVTRDADGPLGDMVDAAGAGLGAWLRSAALELPWLSFRQIDVGVEQPWCEHVYAELLDDTQEPVVAWRSGQRFVPRLERLSREVPFGEAASLLPSEGLFLLAGGLGGVGLAVAQRLREALGARLLLISRRPLDAIGRERLNAAGLTPEFVAHAACDITEDIDVVRAAVREAEARFGRPLAGVLQLAADESLAQRWTEIGDSGVLETTAEQIARSLRAKTVGTLRLLALAATRPGVSFIGFSSVTAHFGAPGLATYAAANAFIDASCSQARLAGDCRAVSLQWSMWEGTGLAAQVPAAVRERLERQGYAIGSRSRCLDALFALAYDAAGARLAYGISDAHPGWSMRGTRPWRALHSLRGFVGGPGTGPAELTLPDALGRQQTCVVTRLPVLPKEADGTISEAGLREQAGEAPRRAATVAPRSESERRLAAVWQSLLGLDSVGVHDSFFDLGGHSLLATQVVSRIRNELGVELPLRRIFESPSLEAQAECLDRLIEQGRQAPIERGVRRRVEASTLETRYVQ